MATKNCDTCPPAGRVGETWKCGHCGEKYRWSGSEWVWVR